MQKLLTLTDVQNEKRRLAASGQPWERVFLDFIRWLETNEELFDEDAKAYSKTFFDRIFSDARDNARKMPDSPAVRAMIRSSSAQLREHFEAHRFVRQLEASPSTPDDLINDWTALAEHSLEIFLDWLFDVCDRKTRVGYDVVLIGLLYSCFDEFVAAIHLSRHKYSLQSNTHLRTVLETLDQVELFSRDRSWIDVWVGDDRRRSWNELKPSAVRKKLGLTGPDEVYGFLSGTGAHPSIKGFKERVLQRVEDTGLQDQDAPTVAIVSLGGTRTEWLRVVNLQLGIAMIGRAVAKLVSCFPSMLNEQEVDERLAKQTAMWRDFTAKHIAPWLEDHGEDAAPLLDLLKPEQQKTGPTEG